MDGMVMGSPWSASEFAATLLMWTVMMALMMLPSSIPMLRSVSVASRGATSRGETGTPVALVAFGYVLAWSVFSIGASFVQQWLHSRMLLSGDMALTDARIAAVLLIGAGAYQFTPAKAACLGRCRSPFPILLHRWKSGVAGALQMGVEHGASCVACCWPLMLVLFIVGVMNLGWIVLLTAVVAVEKLAPGARWPRWAVGAALASWGAVILFRGFAS
jgi:predicted metal-binding membrane protein